MCVHQYSVPVVKYDRNGFRPRLRQLIFTLEAAYLVEEAKIKQRMDYGSLRGEQAADRAFRRQVVDQNSFKGSIIPDFFPPRAGVSVSNLSDNFLILHVSCDDIKQKVAQTHKPVQTGSVPVGLLSHFLGLGLFCEI